MAMATGWRREDAVVSEATQRLERWASSGLWRARQVDEGAPLLAHALAELLGARSLLLLVRAPNGAWQPTAWSQNANQSEPFLSAEPREDEGPALLARELEAPGVEPLMRDEWTPDQAAFAAFAAQAAQSQLRQNAADLTAEAPGLGGAGSTMAASLAEEPGRVASTRVASTLGVLDTENRADDVARRGGGLAPIEEGEPSLLLPLPSLGEDGGASGGSAGSTGGVCGVALAWIESDDGAQSDEWRPLWKSCAGQAAAWLEGATLFERVARSYRDLALLTARVVDARDERREGHGALVAYACVLMAQALGLGEREAEEWEVAGLMHGIGRVAIPDAVLQQEGALSSAERESIRASMLRGAHWLGEVEGWQAVSRLVKHAGERWDGGGHPDGLQGEAIPMGSRALAIALRFASLAQGRPDRDALGSLLNVGVALEYEAGRALDPNLVALFLAALRGPREAVGL